MSLPRFQRGDAAACSGPVRGNRVSGTPAAPLRIFPLTLRFGDSFISVRAAAARSVRAGSVHPSTRLSIRLRTALSLRPPGGASASASGKVRHIILDRRTWQLSPWSASHHREIITAFSLVSLAAGVCLFVCFYVRREQCNNKPVVKPGGVSILLTPLRKVA